MSFIGNLCRFGMFFIGTELFRRLFCKFRLPTPESKSVLYSKAGTKDDK